MGQVRNLNQSEPFPIVYHFQRLFLLKHQLHHFNVLSRCNVFHQSRSLMRQLIQSWHLSIIKGTLFCNTSYIYDCKSNRRKLSLKIHTTNILTLLLLTPSPTFSQSKLLSNWNAAASSSDIVSQQLSRYLPFFYIFCFPFRTYVTRPNESFVLPCNNTCMRIVQSLDQKNINV